ncbi:L-arabinose isomerase [Spirochaetia bacterium]|nr:L-arabinose isomerase [Spirochaetia bacterium]
MEKYRKPKIGLLGLMTDGYESIFKGITARQISYAGELVSHLAPAADIYFTAPAMNRLQIEERMREYNNAGLDGILIVLLAYSQGAWLTRALRDNRLPLALAVVQPDDTISNDFEELDLTVNQGIHGAQDNCNVIARLGIPCQIFAGSRHDQRFIDFVENFGYAAMTVSRLAKLRTAVFCRMQGMGDILTDDLGFLSALGVESCHETIGSVCRIMETVSAEKIEEQIEKDRKIADVDPKLSHESHGEAARIYLGFKGFLEQNRYDAFTAHFDLFAADGRFKQLPLYAASHLLAEGYGYAAEGDSMCASMVAAAHTLGAGGANFTEMYGMDFKQQAILFCHAGEGNWSTHREDIKPRLIDRYLGEGGLENPPTFIFTPRVGPATLVSLVSLGGGKFRLVAAQGEMLDKNDLRRCEMPYFFWRPRNGVEPCVEAWLKQGGTHHEVISLGDLRPRWKMFCDMLKIEYCEV